MDGSWWDYRLWSFSADMNGDGTVTISDVWLWCKWLYFMPGDLVVAMVGPTAFGRFLELTTSSYGSAGSGFLSVILWMLVSGVVISIQEESQG